MDCVTGENFFDVLDNGVVVCHLARFIQDKAKQAVNAGLVKGVSLQILHSFIITNNAMWNTSFLKLKLDI